MEQFLLDRGRIRRGDQGAGPLPTLTTLGIFAQGAIRDLAALNMLGEHERVAWL